MKLCFRREKQFIEATRVKFTANARGLQATKYKAETCGEDFCVVGT